jgi:tetratricopeptide (TPR) repeat protein
MKRINLYILVFTLLLPLTMVKAQIISPSGIEVDEVQIAREGNDMQIMLRINTGNINISSQEMIILTPLAMSADQTVMHSFSPIVITGSKRGKALNRALSFGSYEFPESPQLIVSKNNAQYIPLDLHLQYEEWMHDGILSVKEERIGCACENEGTNQYDISRILPPLFNPEYTLSYITPPVEEVKRRSETYSARINFKVNRYEILHDFKNNADVLSEIDQIIQEVRNDPNLTVSEFIITGYASPEGNYQSNMTLSENRAKSFVKYLSNTYAINPSTIKTDWKGEDWEGLREVVAGLNISDRQNILDIIDNESDILTRKNKLRQLSGGETYRMLLQDYYPPLRRNEYTISYVARSFSIDEAKELIKTKPQHLSLNEMFLVANSYQKNTEEFKQVFGIATRIYPDDPIARLNTATLSLENNEIDTAINQLETIDLPQAWNNLGVAYTQKKEYEKAKIYFDKAANAGLRIGTSNSEQLSKWLDSQQ